MTQKAIKKSSKPKECTTRKNKPNKAINVISKAERMLRKVSFFFAIFTQNKKCVSVKKVESTLAEKLRKVNSEITLVK